MKKAANEIFGIFEKYKNGYCSYDRALEDVANIIIKYSDERPIVGYFRASELKRIFRNILDVKKVDSQNQYYFDCKLPKSNIEDIEKIYTCIENV